MPLRAAQLRDLLLYVLAGIATLAIILYFATSKPRVSLNEFHTWFSLGFFTVLLTIVLAKAYWPMRHSLGIWLLLAGFIAVHTAAFVTFFGT